MIYKAEDVIEKLYRHANDYAEGKAQNFEGSLRIVRLPLT